METNSKKQILEDNRRKDQEITQLQVQLVGLKNTLNEKESEGNEVVLSLNNQIDLLHTEITELKKQITLLSDEIRKKELSRFASAYSVQEMEYKTQQDTWFKYSLWATLFLAVSVLCSIFGSQLGIEKQWYQEPGFYLLNFIFITLFVYSLKQHAHLGNLRVDYANRKTLAQSYQHIIEDEEEFVEIKTRFLERAADIFSSPALFRSSDVTPHESLLGKILGNKDNNIIKK